MENSSGLQTSQDSPITFPPDGFRWLGTIGFLISIAVVFIALAIIGTIWYMASNHLDLYGVQRAMMAMPGVTIQSIAEVITIGYILLLLPLVAKSPLADIGFRSLNGRQIGIVVLGAVLMFVIVTPLASLLENVLHFKTPEAAIAVYTHAAGWQKAAFAVFGIVVAPAFEESVFRIVLFNAMRKWWGFWAGAIVSSVLFGLAHLQPPFTGAMFASITFPLMIGGFILCWVYAKTNNAWSSFITHGAFNAITFALLAVNPNLAK
ncbi:MAG TPA: type II CAAX endopeptidase family protein [Candidatus Baltobacteraceae bacterium]